MNNRRPVIAAGTMLGIGMGGFVDGILFHQILQIHSMFSAQVTRSTVVGLEINMFWDGLFHAFTWMMTAIGIAMLWRVARQADVNRSNTVFLGSLGLGWGLFNLVEGVINHHVLQIHHVTETANHLFYDSAFLASGILLVVVGWSMIAMARAYGPSPREPRPSNDKLAPTSRRLIH
jgi:uncharacterized membrane protein